MTPHVVALLAAGAVAWAVPSGRRGADRVRDAVRCDGATGRLRAPWWAWSIPIALVLGLPGVLLLVSAGTVGAVWSRDAPARRQRDQEAQLRRAAPLAYDLLATCIEVGLSLPVAARVVALSVGSPIAPVLDTFAATLERGCSLDDAAAPLSPGALADLSLALLGAESGGPGLGAALRVIAADERESAGATARANAKRAGVWAVGPLTLCFLPAFVLVGVVPVVAGLLADLPG